MPGSYPKSSDGFTYLPYKKRGDMSFFIGPLKDGVQEFEVLDWLGCYY
jgi:hypothetical protein